MTRVVVYRNGVAYFERAGRVDTEKIAFKVRSDSVGDFLATLSVMEKGGSSVRAAAFPAGNGVSSNEDLMSVELELDGERHDLAVGYVTEQPVWKPSYRLVFGPEGPYLQSWGIVQNLSGEDWSRVQLSLVAGAPIAFEATLGTAVTPTRPVVDDSGEFISAVPRSETTLAQGPPVQDAAPSLPPSVAEKKERRSRAPGKAMMPAPPQAMPAPESAADAMTSVPRSLALLASLTVEPGTTRYDLPAPVTIPKDSATMVLLSSTGVPGEAVHMYAPDPAVPDSVRHPFRVARFKNASAGLMERGPIAIFEQGAFLGQGLLEPLASGAEATVPFAVDRALAIDVRQKSDSRDVRVARIEAGRLTLERDQVLQTTYRVRNGTQDEVKLVLRHRRTPDMRLHQPPSGTEENVGRSTAMVPTVVKARATEEVTVEERRAWQTAADWMSEDAHTAVRAYLADPQRDSKLSAALEQAWVLREQIRKATDERRDITARKNVLHSATVEARASLKAIERSTSRDVVELRRRLSERLLGLDRELEDANSRFVELELKHNELMVRFAEAVRELQLSRTTDE